MASSFFRADLKESEIVEEFLDTHVYPEIFTATERKKDRESQFAGIDIICDSMLCDEKAQIAYKNTPLPTQVLELSFLSKGKDKKKKRGWFIDNKVRTETYIFVFFPEVSDVKKRWERLSTYEQLDKVEIMIVDKKQLKEVIEQKCSLNELVRIGHSMRDGELPTVKKHKGFKLMLSERLAEKPVNIVYPKRDFPVMVHAVWTRDSGVDIVEDNR